MAIRRMIYPDDLEQKIDRVAGFLGFEYTHIRMGSFPMKWYETYGLHSKDYIFDRFEPETFTAGLLKGVFLLGFFLTYIALFGLWLTVFGMLFDDLAGVFRRDRRDRMVE